MAKFNKILLVEDDIFIVELYKRALTKAGYDVTAVLTGPEGLKEGKKGDYDLMLLDIMIPDMTGVEVLNELREEKNLSPNMKIVITTNLDQDDESKAKVEQLADGYIIKADVTPKRLIELIHRIEAAGVLGKVEESDKE